MPYYGPWLAGLTDALTEQVFFSGLGNHRTAIEPRAATAALWTSLPITYTSDTTPLSGVDSAGMSVFSTIARDNTIFDDPSFTTRTVQPVVIEVTPTKTLGDITPPSVPPGASVEWETPNPTEIIARLATSLSTTMNVANMSTVGTPVLDGWTASVTATAVEIPSAAWAVVGDTIEWEPIGATDFTGATEIYTTTNTLTTGITGADAASSAFTVEWPVATSGPTYKALGAYHQYIWETSFDGVLSTEIGVRSEITAAVALTSGLTNLLTLHYSTPRYRFVSDTPLITPPLIARSVGRADTGGIPPLLARGRGTRQERLLARGPL